MNKDISFSSKDANQGIKQDRNLLAKNGTNKEDAITELIH